MEDKHIKKKLQKKTLKQEWLLVFVTYFPPQDFFERLQLTLDLGYTAIVFENTPVLSPELDKLKSHPAFVLLHEASNKGLGYAMKRGMQKAFEMGFAQAVYFDQDTLFTAKSLQWISQWLSEATQLDAFAAIQFAPNTAKLADDNSIIKKHLLINSACCFSLHKLEQLGWHDENYFVEGVDYKFCLDAAAKGYLLGMVNACPGIDHEAAQPMKQRTLFGRNFSFRLYSAQRQRRFLAVLVKLAVTAFRRGQWRYVWIFSRNIATHLLSQAWFLLLYLLPQADKQSKSGNTKTLLP